MTAIRIPVHVRGSSPRAARAQDPARPPHAPPDDRPAERTVRDRADATSQDGVDGMPRVEALPCPEQTGPAPDCPDHEALLSDVLSIADDIERALAAAPEETPIRKGVEVTHRGVMHVLRKHGLERIEAEQRPFDPHWHEAVHVVSAAQRGVDPGTVVQVLASGYRRGAQLFRPARVVVAQ